MQNGSCAVSAIIDKLLHKRGRKFICQHTRIYILKCSQLLFQEWITFWLLLRHHFTEYLSCKMMPQQEWCYWTSHLCDNWTLPDFENTNKICIISLLSLVTNEFICGNKVLLSGHHLLNDITSWLMMSLLFAGTMNAIWSTMNKFDTPVLTGPMTRCDLNSMGIQDDFCEGNHFSDLTIITIEGEIFSPFHWGRNMVYVIHGSGQNEGCARPIPGSASYIQGKRGEPQERSVCSWPPTIWWKQFTSDEMKETASKVKKKSIVAERLNNLLLW